jgi:hypothetical protein
MPIEVGGETNPPFAIADVLAVGSLVEALDRLVFNHPRVAALRQRAMSAMKAGRGSFYDNAGFAEPVYGHDELMLPLKVFGKKDYEKMSNDEYDALARNSGWNGLLSWSQRPEEYVLFHEELELRCFTLIGMLQHREIEGVCYIHGKGERETLLHTVWSRDDLYVHIRTGDIYEARSLRMIKRWIAVAFQLPGTSVRSQAGPVEGRTTTPKKGGPPEQYSWPVVKVLLQKHMDTGGNFRSHIDLRKWCRARVKRVDGKPKSPGLPDSTSIDSAIDRHGLKEIAGLRDPPG